MTKFRDLTNKADGKKTVFEKYINTSGETENNPIQPDQYDLVEYLGSNGVVDFFRAKDEGAKTYGFFIGKKGDEFN